MTSNQNVLLVMVAAGALAACAGHGLNTGAAKGSGEPAAVGMVNPASAYCVKQGGRLELRKDAAGNEFALCHLPDGRVVDEWAFFRSSQKR